MVSELTVRRKETSSCSDPPSFSAMPAAADHPRRGPGQPVRSHQPCVRIDTGPSRRPSSAAARRHDPTVTAAAPGPRTAPGRNSSDGRRLRGPPTVGSRADPIWLRLPGDVGRTCRINHAVRLECWLGSSFGVVR